MWKSTLKLEISVSVCMISKATCSALQNKVFIFFFLGLKKTFLDSPSYSQTFEAVCSPERSEVRGGKVHESVSKGVQPSDVL